MPFPNKFKQLATDLNTTEDALLKALMRKHGSLFKVAISVDMYPNAIRAQLLKRGWTNKDGKWIEPKPEREKMSA